MDENSKLNINLEDVERLKSLISNVSGSANDRLAQNIITYRESNGKMKKFYSVYELLRVKSMENEFLIGEDSNDNRLLDDWEDDLKKNYPEDNRNGDLDLGLKDYLTVYTDGRINLNTVSETILMSMPGMTKDVVKAIMDYRKSTPFQHLDDLKNITIISEKTFQQIAQWATIQSNWFKVAIKAKAQDSNAESHIVAVVDRSISPAKIVYWRED
jgi:DNA uptake protein ComE-like DNA-binding protein